MSLLVTAADSTDEDVTPWEASTTAALIGKPWLRRASAIAAAASALAGTVACLHSRQPPSRHSARPSDSVQLIDRSTWKMGDPNWWNTKCPGQIPFEGFSEEPLEMVNTYYTTPFHQAGAAYAVKDGEATDTRTEGVADTVKVSLSGRSYFANSCEQNDHSDDDDPGIYDDVKYVKMKLLGKKLKYTTNISKLGCGWDASLALTEMAFNTDPTKCKDFYCDSLGTCGAKCAEISLQEANNRAWFTSLHVANDGQGVGVGYGGDAGDVPRRDWDSSKYGPESECIDTTQPFQVAVSFPMDSFGKLAKVDVELSQDECSVSASITEYLVHGVNSMEKVGEALERGVTPTFSVWGSTQMYWLDGQGEKQDGPCKPDEENPEDGKLQDQDFAEWSGFSVENLEAPHDSKAAKSVSGHGDGKSKSHHH